MPMRSHDNKISIPLLSPLNYRCSQVTILNFNQYRFSIQASCFYLLSGIIQNILGIFPDSICHICNRGCTTPLPLHLRNRRYIHNMDQSK